MRPPSLSKWDIAWSILPFLLWALLVVVRPHVLRTHCGGDLSGCPKSQVLSIDQPGLGIESGPADGYSYLTQNFSGVLAVSVPLGLHAIQAVAGTVSPAVALAQAGADFVLFVETAGINGSVTEAVRLIVQRPRPYVYAHPEQGLDPQNYVSFYSGHTSFTAAACFCLLLILLSRSGSFGLLFVFGVMSQCLIISTAVFRILAGRHFLTDVLAGAIMGAAVALAVAYFHRASSPGQSQNQN
jgi:membrane-associated phospholipid phosphatase